MKSNSFTEIVPIFIIFKAMGMESEQVIIESILYNQVCISIEIHILTLYYFEY